MRAAHSIKGAARMVGVEASQSSLAIVDGSLDGCRTDGDPQMGTGTRCSAHGVDCWSEIGRLDEGAVAGW
ncbi:hypothetical protein [Candidatus Reidiella endopervernicosa]|uniref:Hpt domain-containing protein n=1 Tax=Candidatus Reidiella endopervernicosa TaxID=2738883 RepID=A0A6N0HVC0_9GAMM|nr:hypothetical protein HUE57_08315 [Candidatus Reidiella endopervernicosa]